MPHDVKAIFFKRMNLMCSVVTALLKVSATWNSIFTTAMISNAFKYFYVVIQAAWVIYLYKNVDYGFG